jgi:hypothetical protein
MRGATLGRAVLSLLALTAWPTAARAGPEAISFRQGENGYLGTSDTFLSQAAPSTYYGAWSVVEWDGDDAGGQNFGLLRFGDIFGAGVGRIPPKSFIIQATLTYEVGNSGNDGTVNEVLAEWTESTTYDTFGGEPGVQADEYGALVGTALGGSGPQSLDVTASLSTWSDGPAANKGWVFRPTGGTDGVQFYSSDYGTAAVRPRLDITYLALTSEIGFYPAAVDTVVGSADLDAVLAIPPGSNDVVPVEVVLISDDPSVAVPVDAVGGVLVVTFAAGGPTHQTVSIDVGQAGVCGIATTNDAGLEDTSLPVNVGPGAVSFQPAYLASLADLDVAVDVRLTPGSNDMRTVQVSLSTDDAAVAEPGTAGGGELVLTFAAGAPSSQVLPIDVGVVGDATITTLNDGGLVEATLPVHVFTGFMFSATSDMRNFTGPGEFPAVLDAISATGGPGVFMVCPGDIDPPQEVDAALDAEFGPGFTWYPVVGNHEAETPEDMAWIRGEFPSLPCVTRAGPSGSEETTYAFDYADAHFVVLDEYYDGYSDVGTDGDIVPALYAWLEADLRDNTRKWVFVLGHEPAYPQPDMHWGTARHVGDSLDQYPLHRDAFWALLDAYNAAAYVAAHTHGYSRYFQDEVWQLDSAQARGSGASDTFLRLLVGTDQIVLHAYRSLDGAAFRLVDTITMYAAYADFDDDADIDYDDVVIFSGCLSGPDVPTPPGGCAPELFDSTDVDGDGDTDLADFRAVQRAFTG